MQRSSKFEFSKFKFRRKIIKIFNYKGKKLCDYIVYTNEYNKHISIFRDGDNRIKEVEISDIIKEAVFIKRKKTKK